MLATLVVALAWHTAPPVARRARTSPPAMCATEDKQATNDKQMSNPELIRFSSLTDEWQALSVAALKRLDRNRFMQGKPKYETIEGMTDAYVEEASNAGLGWTRDDAESEVVRYLMRQALADEGGIGEGGGDGQDKAAFALLSLLLGVVASQGLLNPQGVMRAFQPFIGALQAFHW